MKYTASIAFLLTLIVISFALPVYAGHGEDAELFVYDQEAITTQLNELEILETYLAEHPNVNIQNLHYLQWSGADAGIQNTFSMMAPQFRFEGGPFFLGLCCWPVGLFTHGINKKKHEDKRWSYLIGAIIGVVWTVPVGLFTGCYALTWLSYGS